MAHPINAGPKGGQPEPTYVTPFITEDDLNKVMFKFLYWAIGISAPILLMEFLRWRQEKKNNNEGFQKEMRESISEIMLLLRDQPEKMRRIAREEMKYAQDLRREQR